MNRSPRFCPNCDAPLTPGARFCNQCGASLDSIQPTQVSPTPQKASEPSHERQVAPAYVVEPRQAAPPGYHRPSAAPAKEPNRALQVLGVLGIGLVCLCLGLGLAWGYVNFIADGDDDATPVADQASATATHTMPPDIPSDTPIPPEPTSTPEAPPPTLPPTQPPGREVSYANITFYHDPSLAQNVNVETAPQSNYADAPYFEIYPEHSRFTFIGYPLYPDAFHTPQMMVYPAAGYAAINPGAAEVISRLQNILAQRPPAPPPEGLPFLPIWNAAQIMQAHMRYVDFQNGSGVRYLAQYGQAAWPINNKDIFYTFQGLTHDGQAYVSAIFPVSNPILPAAESVVLDDAFYNNFESYVQNIETQLDAQPDSSFTPNLSLLDQLIHTLIIR